MLVPMDEVERGGATDCHRVARAAPVLAHVDQTESVDGDVGTVVHVLGPTDYVVECVHTDGRTAWVADLNVDELAPKKS
jgi:catabolite regulation protein CreA